MADIAILGGGFGGLAAAHELRRLLHDDHRITVVARDGTFAMGWTKLWDLVGIRPISEGTRSLAALAGRGVDYLQADITRIDPQRRVVLTSRGELRADGLVVALGAVDQPELVARLGGDAHNLYDPAALPAMRAALERLHEGRLVVAVTGQPFKCPPAPFEAVLLVDEYLRARGVRAAVELVITTPGPSALPVAGPEASGIVARALAERDIDLRTGHVAVEVDAPAHLVRFEGGARVDFAVLLAVPGAAAPAVLRDSPLAAEGGWVRPDRRTLRTGFERVYAVGDCTTVPTATAALPKAGVFADAEARIAARNLAADLGVGEPAEFDGHGFCYLEFPGRAVARVEGDFFAEPQPRVVMTPPSPDAYQAKLEHERDRLAAWFG